MTNKSIDQSPLIELIAAIGLEAIKSLAHEHLNQHESLVNSLHKTFKAPMVSLDEKFHLISELDSDLVIYSEKPTADAIPELITMLQTHFTDGTLRKIIDGIVIAYEDYTTNIKTNKIEYTEFPLYLLIDNDFLLAGVDVDTVRLFVQVIVEHGYSGIRA